MFNCKEKSLKLSFDTILGSLKLDNPDDPSETVWYIDNDESIVMVVHPRYGVVFYNDEMLILGIYQRTAINSMLDLIDGWDYDNTSQVWREIGIDQIDYNPV